MGYPGQVLKQGGKEFFFEKIRRARTFFLEKNWGPKLCLRKRAKILFLFSYRYFPETRPGYPIDFAPPINSSPFFGQKVSNNFLIYSKNMNISESMSKKEILVS